MLNQLYRCGGKEFPGKTNAPINVKPAVEGGVGGRWGIGWDVDQSLWPGGRAFILSCCPGGRGI